jgi:hypothetical protein
MVTARAEQTTPGRRATPIALGAALKAARFLNLALASLLTGNGVGGERFVHPALRTLPPRAYLEAERPRWDRFNRLRTLLAAAGWSLLCLGALADTKGA